MHIKFLKFGTGDAKKATTYLLADHDHKGIRRAGVAVLRGNPGQVAEVANSVPFVYRYSSAVIAWANEDHPTSEQIEQTLNDFEKLAFAGLTPERYSWTAVQHIEDNGSLHIHVLAARVDLLTGKSLNIAPPGWQKDFDSLRDAMNHENGWARPDDPARARLVQTQHHTLIDAASLRSGLKTSSDPKKEITSWLIQRIRLGLVTDRASIVSSLAEIGEITRQGADYISVKPQASTKAIRLKGALYGATFKSNELASDPHGVTGAGQITDRSANERAAQIARAAFEDAVRRRSNFNKKNYAPSRKKHGRANQRSNEEGWHDYWRNYFLDTQARPTDSARNNLAEETLDLGDQVAHSTSADVLPMYLRRDLALLDANLAEGIRDSANEKWLLPSAERELDNVQHGHRKEASSQTVQSNQWRLIDTFKDIYDRVRTEISQSISGAWRAIRGGHDAVKQASAELENAARLSEQNKQRADAAIQQRHGEFNKSVGKLEQQTEQVFRLITAKQKEVRSQNNGERRLSVDTVRRKFL